jgi:hypothetical protein
MPAQTLRFKSKKWPEEGQKETPLPKPGNYAVTSEPIAFLR